MYKNVMKVAFVAAIAMVSGISVFNSQKSEVLSDVAAANVEALAAFVVNRMDCELMEGMQCYVPVSTPEGGYCEVYYDQKNKH